MVALIRELKNEGKIKLGDPKSGFGRLGERATRLCVFFFFLFFHLISVFMFGSRWPCDLPPKRARA